MVRLLVENGAYVNGILRQENAKWTPLRIAVHHNHYDVTAFLIEKGADVNFKNSNGGNFLHKVAWEGDVEMARILIKGGIDIHTRDDKGTTPLRIGVQEDHLEFVRLIFDADENTANNSLSSLLRLAEHMGHDNMFQFLFDRALSQQQKEHKKTVSTEETNDVYKPIKPHPVEISIWHTHNIVWELYKKTVPEEESGNEHRPAKPQSGNSVWHTHNLVWEIYKRNIPEGEADGRHKPVRPNINDSIWHIHDMVWELYKEMVPVEKRENDYEPEKPRIAPVSIWYVHNMLWELYKRELHGNKK